MLVVMIAGIILLYHRHDRVALAGSIDINIDAKIIPHFKIGSKDQIRFGALLYKGGIEFDSDNGALGGLSGIRVLDGGRKFCAYQTKADGLAVQ